MKKFLLTLFLAAVTMISMNSCVASAYSQDVAYGVDYNYDGSDVDINVVVRLGSPFYFENTILYYLYDGWYYYPYFHNGHYYYYRYRRPFPTHPGYRFTPGRHHRPYAHRGTFAPDRRHDNHGSARPGHHGRPGGHGNHGNHGVNPRPQGDNHGNHGVTPRQPQRGGGSVAPRMGGHSNQGVAPRPQGGSRGNMGTRVPQGQQQARPMTPSRQQGSVSPNRPTPRSSSTYQTAPRPHSGGGFSGGSRGSAPSRTPSMGGGSRGGGSHGGGHFGGRR